MGTFKGPSKCRYEIKISRKKHSVNLVKNENFLGGRGGSCFFASCFLTNSFDRILDLKELEFIGILVLDIYFYPYLVTALAYEHNSDLSHYFQVLTYPPS